jgi:hypothetical protein
MTTTTQATKPILVLGATGKTGRRVLARLTAHGVPTRAGSRSAPSRFDWEDRSTWAPALRDVKSVYISYYPDIAVPGAVETVGSFAELAVTSGSRGWCCCPAAARPRPSAPSRPCATPALS